MGQLNVLGCLIVVTMLNSTAIRMTNLPFPTMTEMKLSTESAVQSTALMALGMRRLAADLAFVQLMLYYGTPEPGLEHEDHAHEGPGHNEYEGGSYPEIVARTLQIMDMDPYSVFSVLYSAGALAFNLDKPDDALRLLEIASSRDPRQWKYRSYIAGIGFSKKGNAQEALRELTPILSEPDCPVLLKNLLAFLNRRLGRRDEAIRIYRDILKSKDPSYNHVAKKALAELGASEL